MAEDMNSVALPPFVYNVKPNFLCDFVQEGEEEKLLEGGGDTPIKKPRRRPNRPKQRSHLEDSFPGYLQVNLTL